MFKPLSLYIGLRYVRAKRRNHFISFISFVSMFGIALGVMVLITVVSVMNGFQKELRERILGMVSHATIEGFREPVRDWQGAAAQARQHPQVLGAAPYIEGQALVNVGELNSGVMIRGIEPDYEDQVSEIRAKLRFGRMESLAPKSYHILIGIELAEKLGVNLGDKITVIIPKAHVTPAGLVPRFRRFTVGGIFEIGMNEYDSGLVVMHLADAARLYRMQDGVSGVRLKTADIDHAKTIAREVGESLGGQYYVGDWTYRHQNLFNAVALEKRLMFFVLFLIVAVAAFNIVSTLVMMVTDKQSDIAILRTLGARTGTVMGVFVVQGMIIGVIGTLLGGVLGITLAIHVEEVVSFLERLFGMELFPSNIYYISKLKGDVQRDDVTIILLGSLIISLLVTLYPARRAANTQPAEALRYE